MLEVSILVLVEAGLRLGVTNSGKTYLTKFQSLFWWKRASDLLLLLGSTPIFHVSILVLVEAGLRPVLSLSVLSTSASFNPCFGGSGPQTFREIEK